VSRTVPTAMVLAALACAWGCSSPPGPVADVPAVPDEGIAADAEVAADDDATPLTDAAGDAAGDLPPGDGTADADAGADAGPPWGWISVVEPNDTWDYWFYKTQWLGGVRAYFAQAASWPRSLPHTLEFAQVRGVEGACRFYDGGLMDVGCEDCFCLDKGIECTQPDGNRWCGEDEWCVQGPERPENWPDRGMCVALPRHFDVGPITLSGLKAPGPVVMQPDSLDRYLASGLPDPDDLFAPGDVVTATTGGGDLPPMSFAARGVAPLELPGNTLTVRLGQPLVVRWVPADPGTRVQVVLRAGSHEPYPLSGSIVCDLEDEAGEVEVPAGFLVDLYGLGCDGAYLYKSHSVTRYTRDGDRIQLFVGSARNLVLAWE
jgi:hypothetical protein